MVEQLEESDRKMAVSTATYRFDGSITFVTAEGTLAEVMSEVTSAASSAASLNHLHDLITIIHDGTDYTAIWTTRKTSW